MKLAEVKRTFVATGVRNTDLEKICLDTTLVFEADEKFYFMAWYPTGSCSITDVTEATAEQAEIIRKALV